MKHPSCGIRNLWRGIPDARGAIASVVLLVATLFVPGLVPQADASALRVPPGGVRVELWSDPEPGSIVYPGQLARVYFRANTDCYVTLIAVDTEGRVRLLFPAGRDDGWVRGGRTYRLPATRGERIVFEGPTGIEYMYALASLEPTRHRYPMWLVDGRVWDPDPWYLDDDYHLYNYGLVIGDPFYQIHQFCRALVPNPDWIDTYSTAFISFYVGRRVHYPRYVCSDCHWGGWIDPYARTCRAVAIHVGDIRYRGWIDFRVVFAPRYTYRVSYAWRPLWWRGERWSGPDGRYVWSSTDRRGDIRRYFADAGPRAGRTDRPVPTPTGKPDQPYRVTRDGERVQDGVRDRHAWERAHQERLRSSVKDQGSSRESDSPPRSPRAEEPPRERKKESDRAPRSPRVEEAPSERAPESGRPPRSPRAEEPPRERKKESDRAPRSPRTEEAPSERAPRSGRSPRSS